MSARPAVTGAARAPRPAVGASTTETTPTTTPTTGTKAVAKASSTAKSTARARAKSTAPARPGPTTTANPGPTTKPKTRPKTRPKSPAEAPAEDETNAPRKAVGVPAAKSVNPASPRRRSKRGEGRHLRDEILNAAEAIMVQTGSVDKVTTRAVAQRVGCSSPSIYLHFPDRASMLIDMCQLQFDHLGAALAEGIEGIDDPIERLCEIGRAYARFALDHPQQYRTMMMDVIAGVAYEATLEEMRSDLGFDIVVSAITDGIAAGALAPTDPLLSTFALWAQIHGVVSILIAKPHAGWGDADPLIDFALAQAIEGLRAR